MGKQYRCAYVGGTFDLTHYGHFALFKRAKDIAATVVVSLNTDEFNERYKGRKPLLSLRERTAACLACRYVDAVTTNIGDEDSKPAILATRADVIIHDDSWTGEALMEQMGLTYEWLDEHGIDMVYFPRTEGISTTNLIERVCEASKT